FSTPRTAEKMWRYYADNEMPLDIKQAAMAGVGGDGPAAEAWAFVKSWQQIAALMPRILKEPTKVDVPEEISLQYAVSVAISGSLTIDNCPNYHMFLTRMEPEFVVLAWTMAVK